MNIPLKNVRRCHTYTKISDARTIKKLWLRGLESFFLSVHNIWEGKKFREKKVYYWQHVTYRIFERRGGLSKKRKIIKTEVINSLTEKKINLLRQYFCKMNIQIANLIYHWKITKRWVILKFQQKMRIIETIPHS